MSVRKSARPDDGAVGGLACEFLDAVSERLMVDLAALVLGQVSVDYTLIGGNNIVADC
jgi:hypothetical protein